MDRLFTPQAPVDFGPNYLLPFAPAAPAQLIEGERPAVLRGRLRQSCPKKPGVYGMFNARGDLVYVGKAKNLRCRLLSYFRTKSRDKKAGRIMANTVRMAWEVTGSEFAALHRELELIRRWRPRFNVVGRPDARRPTYVCLGRLPAPYVFLARRPPREALASYGPVSAGRRAAEAVRRLNDLFRLRDCPQSQEMAFADQGELFPVLRSPGCLRYEIGTCLGPCTGSSSRDDYYDRVHAARSFLEGTDLTVLKVLLKEMQAAADAQVFERAAALRDKLQVLGWLHQQLTQTRELRANGSFVYPLTGHDGQTVWFLIHAGQTVAALPEPACNAARRAARQLIEEVYRTEHVFARESTLARRDSILLVAAWFRRYPAERDRTWSPDQVLAKLG